MNPLKRFFVPGAWRADTGGVKPRRPRLTGLFEQADIIRDLTLSADVVVIGSGAGGATIACELAEAGLDVLVLEEGGYHPTETFDARAGRALRRLYRDAGAQTTIGTAPVIFSEGRCVGGSTVVNGGMSWRTPERILEGWSNEGQVSGITAREMERHFQKVEGRINVAHQDPESIGRDHQLLHEAAVKQGWKVIPNTRNQLHCAGTNNCAFGCPVGAKRSTLVTYVPRALSRGARLYADVHVERVTFERGRATGVSARVVRPGGARGPKLTVKAKAVVVAGGSIQTPALLMRSGVKAKELGRNLYLHPNTKLLAIFDEDVMGWQGVHQAYQVREFMDDGILITAINIPPSLVSMTIPHYGAELGELMTQYNRMVVAGCLIEDSTSGHIKNLPGIGPMAFYDITPRDAERAMKATALTAELMFAAGAKRVILPFEGLEDIYSVDEARALLKKPVPASAMEFFTVHLMGTARMSDDPARGVTGSHGAVHGHPGLFVADASLFPGPVGVNPMETIMGIATRNAEWMLENRGALGL